MSIEVKGQLRQGEGCLIISHFREMARQSFYALHDAISYLFQLSHLHVVQSNIAWILGMVLSFPSVGGDSAP